MNRHKVEVEIRHIEDVFTSLVCEEVKFSVDYNDLGDRVNIYLETEEEKDCLVYYIEKLVTEGRSPCSSVED
jgi:hypothetical protein